MRYKLTIEYDGTGLLGWQRQKDGITVQGCMEQAVKRFCGQQLLVQCSGRTDAGVHARGQVAHIDIVGDYSCYQIREGINFHLRDIVPNVTAICVQHVEEVTDEFHARFHATKRHYSYTIINRDAPIALYRQYAWWVKGVLDIKAMQQAASYLTGTHDFSSFRAAECQSKSPVKTLDSITIIQQGEQIVVTLQAKSFLHHQVRNIVGTLVKIGKGKWQPEYIQDILAAKNRSAAGPTAPAHGLVFERVEYDSLPEVGKA